MQKLKFSNTDFKIILIGMFRNRGPSELQQVPEIYNLKKNQMYALEQKMHKVPVD